MTKTQLLPVNPSTESTGDLILKAFENKDHHVGLLIPLHYSDVELERDHLGDYIAQMLFGSRGDDVDSISCKPHGKHGDYYTIEVDMCLKKILDDCTIIKNIQWDTGGVNVSLPTEAVMLKAVGEEGREEVNEFLFQMANCEWEPIDFDIVW